MSGSDDQSKLAAGTMRDRVSWEGAGPPIVILLATFLTYGVTLGFGFVFDDHVLIVANDSIRSWRYIPTYFSSHIWSFTYPHLLANYYRPLFLVWLRLNDALFGLHPWGWHLTSVFVHLAVTYLVYRLALRLSQDRLVAAASGLLFGIHPVHSEPVADITSAQEPLSTMFILAALLAWLWSRQPGRKAAGLALALVCCVGALLSKESGMMLPAFVAILAWMEAANGGEVSLGVRARSVLTAIAPFLMVTGVYVPLRIWALKGFAHTVTPLPFRTEILTAPSVLLFYLRLLVWPFGLSCYYDTPYISAPTFRDFVLPLILVLATTASLGFWYGRARRRSLREARLVGFASLWIAIALMPVLNFRLFPEGELAHDRYVYLASVGFSLLVGVALGQTVLSQPRLMERPGRILAASAAAVLLISALTVSQSLYWSDDLSLNARAHHIAPHNVFAAVSLGAAADERGMPAAATALYLQVLAEHPDFWRANVNLGYLYYRQGRYSDAAQYFERACRSDPTDGNQFLYLGMSFLQLGRLPDAEKAIRMAMVIRPQGKDYHTGLGIVLKQAGRWAEARQEFEAELARDPQDVRARHLLADVDNKLSGQSKGHVPTK